MDGLSIRKLQLALQKNPSKKIAWEIVNEFYEMYHKDSVNNHLWFLATSAMTNEAEDLTTKLLRDLREVVLLCDGLGSLRQELCCKAER